MAVKKSEIYASLWQACDKLRGGVEPARYKDYILLLLFFKYVSDKYQGQPYAPVEILPGGSFADLAEASGKNDVGERADEIIEQFEKANHLIGILPEVSFNNEDELGHGKELADKVSGLIDVFQRPELDFRRNRAGGDDIIGDAYEFLMMKFAQESGKSKGQFYTPGEVSRVIARLIGIGGIDPEARNWTLYDPACGSGSLLIRAADEAPLAPDGEPCVSIYGQEKDTATAGLATMNFILHQKGTAEVSKGNTLANPAYTDSFGELRAFDFVVMNPPFSDKSWRDGIGEGRDVYGRFDGYGAPPDKNGDFAWLLHVLKSLKSDGKAGVIMPHGVLFRGNAEETIRRAVLRKRYIKGIVSLPPNLFYGTGIPACIIVIDKANADERDGVFMIDASRGFKKDGDKNRLREQDIERIVQTFTRQIEIDGYSRLVPYEEIVDGNGGNLNVPRYIAAPGGERPQNLAAHINGGVPAADVDTLRTLWDVAPRLKQTLFTLDRKQKTYHLKMAPEQVGAAIRDDADVRSEMAREAESLFNDWAAQSRSLLCNITAETNPKSLIRELAQRLLATYQNARLLDPFAVYDVLLNYWNDTLQDDVYLIAAGGYEVGRGVLDKAFIKNRAFLLLQGIVYATLRRMLALENFKERVRVCV